MREFTDADGLLWRVYEVTPLASPDRAMRASGERRVPWLVFESAESEKRRLSPLPNGWPEDAETRARDWLAAAVHVPPAPAKRREDR